MLCKKIATILEPTTRILHVTSTGAFEGGNLTYFPKLETKSPVWALPIAFVIVISFILVAVVAFFFGRWKCFQQFRTVKSDNEEEDEKASSEAFIEAYEMESSDVFIEEYEYELSDGFYDATEHYIPRITPPSVKRMDIWLKIFLTFVVSHKVKMKRLVVNTTCMELAKPSNQKYRLTCRQLDYHCLLDDTYTQEFEVCREWKWIPEGNCAYFNSYGEGNIDGRLCISSPNLFCPNARYSSAESTKYSTCYVKQNTHTISPTTSSFQVGSDRSRSTSFLFSVTTDKTSDRTWMGMRVYIHVYIAIAFGVLIPSLSFVVLCLRYKKATDGKKDNNSSAEKSEDRIAEQQLLIYVGNNKTEDRPNMMNGSEDYLTVLEKKDGNDEKKNSADASNMSLESMKIKNGDVAKDECTKESCAQITQQTVIIFNEKEDDKESTDVFDDTIESLQRIAPPTDEQDTELCTVLYNLLSVEGLKLSQEVMEAIITSETRKSVKELVADENVLKNLTSDEVLPKEYYWFIENVTREKKVEKKSSIIHILHSLLRIHLDANDHPKSGWGNPVRGTDVGIGDDIERLNRIYIIFRGILNPVTVSVESYIRLLDIMIEALTRLDPDVEFKEDFQVIVRKLINIEIPTLTQTVVNKVKRVLGFVNLLS